MKLLSSVIVAGALVAATGFASAADLPSRAVAPLAPPSATCLESTALPVDAFGFTAGSDVTDLGAIGGTLTYGGAYTARSTRFAAHTGLAQIAFSPLRCFEIAPYFYGTGVNATPRGGPSFNGSSWGGGAEFKYKFLGRDTHGIGLAAVLDLNANSTRVGGASGSFYGVAARLILDAAIVPDFLYAAVNLEHISGFRGSGISSDSSQFNARGALSAKLAPNFFLGAEVLYSRSYGGGSFYDTYAGDGFFVGPNFFWAITDKLTLNAAYSVQVAGASRGGPGRINLTEYTQHLARVRLGYAF